MLSDVSGFAYYQISCRLVTDLTKEEVMDKETLVSKLVEADNARPRTQQVAIGVSSLGDCRRRVWHSLQQHQGTNPVTRLPAILGTAIHAAIESAFAGGFPDRKEMDQPLIEHRIDIDGFPPATIDYYDPLTYEVVDWKTIKLSGADYFVSKQKRWQVQVYGFLLEQAGFPVKTVTLVGIPRDGTEKDIIVHSELYNPDIAGEALAWLREIESLTEAPAPEREPNSFCKSYCQFFGDFCQGIPKDLSGEPITDEAATKAAKRYTQLTVEIKKLEAEKDAAKAALEGQQGVTIDGIKVSWSEIAGRKTPDLDKIAGLLDGDVPMKQGDPSQRLTVK
jgi:hypothetical protein